MGGSGDHGDLDTGTVMMIIYTFAGHIPSCVAARNLQQLGGRGYFVVPSHPLNQSLN